MKNKIVVLSTLMLALTINANAESLKHSHATKSVSDQVIAKQREELAENTRGKNFGPQSPRDIDSKTGSNTLIFNLAPDYHEMNLCNIHFHKGTEHKGGEFTKYAGNGDGHGYQSGFLYTGTLSEAEKIPLKHSICKNEHSELQSGDVIEIHYVHSTAQVKPGPTLASCLSESINNPQLRVEALVYVLVNDSTALNFKDLTALGQKEGFQQALNIPSDLGTPVIYNGSTTGPSYNEKGSPFQVTWAVRPKIAKVNIKTVGDWCKENVFKEDHAHGVRNLVKNPDLLSPIK